MSKIKKILLWSLLGIFVIATLVVVIMQKNKIICRNVEISIVDSSDNNFIQKNDVLAMIYKRHGKIVGYPFESINIAKIEAIINGHAAVKKAQVYKTIDGMLKIDVEQRVPVVRIINNRNQSYYLDKDATIMPLSDEFSARVIIANGNIKEGFALKNRMNFIKQTKDSAENVLRDIYKLSMYIRSNDFLKAQFEQIYVNEDKEFELIPTIGAHVITFGNLENMEDKFRNLFTMYEQGLSRYGWNTYKLINLKYRNQVVCTRR
jgi:cell division protein FtsQ